MEAKMLNIVIDDEIIEENFNHSAEEVLNFLRMAIIPTVSDEEQKEYEEILANSSKEDCEIDENYKTIIKL